MNSKIEQKYVGFSEARSFARSLGLKSRAKWVDWIASNALPPGIPKRPNIVYTKIGWNGWGDFLGTGFVALHRREYMPFQKALEYVHNLKISGRDNWVKWAKSDDRPSNIPADPSRVYKNHWITWGHWLGTNSTSHKNRTFRSFKEAGLFARSLNLKGQLEWRKWAKTDARPHDIPAAPDRTYKKEWKNWYDFLGFKRCHKYRSFEDSKNYLSSLALKGKREFLKARRELHLNDIPSAPYKVYADKWQGLDDFLGNTIRSFEPARDYVRSLGFKNQKQWKLWAESSQRPHDIPKYPHTAYANKGWIDTADFLGYNKFRSSSEVMSLPEAKKFASGLNLKNRTEWAKWAKTDARPKNLPAAPSVYYAGKGWVNWGDFLGTEFIAPQNRSFRSFNEARIYARSLGIGSETEWNAWAKTNKRPVDIPASPRKTYQDDGWNGFGDFLGTGIIANQNRSYRGFNEARTFAQALNFKTGDEWFDWAKTKAKPADIPANPAGVYKENWQGWADFLGFVNKWTVPNIRLFVESILPHLNSLSPAGLYVMFQQTGILDIGRNSRGRLFVQALKTGRFPKEELEKFIAGEHSLVNAFFDDSEMSLEDQEEKSRDDPLISEDKLSIEETLIQGDLPSVDTQGILATLDSKLFSTLDKEAIDFFIKEAVARIWQQAFLDEVKAVEQLELYGDEGTYSQEVKRIFLHDYQGAKNLQIPSGYCFPHQPLLMQLYTAYLIKTRKRLGNWSGTGAGKTLSAILASRVIHAGLTVICCPNNVIGNWERNILEIYPESSVFIKETSVKKDTSKKPKYLILNYEFFQQPKAEQKLKALVDNNIIDFIIIDEIHYSKQREAENESLRKKTISAFLSEASVHNENLHVLGMSATPIINNLFEGKTLIEMVTGVHHDELNTKPTVPNCIAHYQKFVSHGIRLVPQYDYRLNLHTERIDCSEYLSEIKHQSAYGSMVDLEAVLTKAKLPFILDSLRPKTIVYTHYLKDILPVLQEAIENKGWRVAIFTGENKDGLYAFIDGNADILIASSCVGTGVDRLQHVCNRLIVSSLPWTHAEFEQLKGRIYRQGQIKDHVDVFVPLTYADVNGEEWSWCNSRWKRIQFKKSVSDAAVDGVIPEGHLRTPAQAYKDTMFWLERLDRGEIYEIERRKISIPLIGEVKPNVQRRMGDLSQMNSRINHASSSQTHKRFLDHPEEWECYHSIYREDRKSWPVVPYEEAVKWFKARPHMVIGDFGCGEALLAANVENKVFSFDHVSINENVTACDMCHTSLDDACLDAAVFSLSLMGSNFIDYLKEAHRCLKLDGHLLIAEPTSRIQNIELFRDLLFRLGFDVSRVDEKWKFIFIKAIKSERELNQKVLDAVNLPSLLN